MAYQKPQAMIYQQFETVSTPTAEDLRAVIIGPNAILHRYADADEKPDTFIGLFNPVNDSVCAYPKISAGGIVDESYTKLFVDNALLVYYDSENDTTDHEFGYSAEHGYNAVISRSDNIFYVKSTEANPRDAQLGIRDVAIGDYAYITASAPDETDQCKPIVALLSRIIGLTEAMSTPVISGNVDSDKPRDDDSDSTTFTEQLSTSTPTTTTTLLELESGSTIDVFKHGLTYTTGNTAVLGCIYTVTVDKVISNGNCAGALYLRIESSTGEPTRSVQLTDTAGDKILLSEDGVYGNAAIKLMSGKKVADIISAYETYSGVKWVFTKTARYYGMSSSSNKPTTGADATTPKYEFIDFDVEDYDGVSDTYVITCIEGSKAITTTSGPKISISTLSGRDEVASVTLTSDFFVAQTSIDDATTFKSIGSQGLKMRIVQSGATLDEDDPYMVGGFSTSFSVTAKETDAYTGIILADDLPIDARKADVDLSVKLIAAKDIELLPTDADQTNWVATQSDITVYENAKVTDPEFAKMNAAQTSVTPIPLSLFGFGDDEDTEYATFSKMYLNYREWSPVHASNCAFCAGISDLDSVIGPLDIDNPLKWGVYKALTNSNGATVGYVAVKDPSDLDDWQDAISIVEGRSDVYTVVPLTTNTQVQNLVVTLVNSESSAEACRWKTALFSMDLPEEGMVIGRSDGSKVTSSDGNAVLCDILSDSTITDVNKSYVKVTCKSGNARFLDYGVQPGDQLRIVSNGEVILTRTVNQVYSNGTLTITESLPAEQYDKTIEIWHTYNRYEEAQLISDKARSFGNRRIGLVWPDKVYEGALENPGYFLCAALAGLKSGVAPEQGLTRQAIQGFDDYSRSKPRYTESQLDTMAGNGVWICVQDSTGAAQSRHAITTSTVSTFYSEEMMTRNFDSISKYMYQIIDTYIGTSNVTDETLRAIYFDLRNACDWLIAEGQMINYTTITVKQHDLLLDRVVAYLNVGLPFAVNNVELYITAEAYKLDAVTLESEAE